MVKYLYSYQGPCHY